MSKIIRIFILLSCIGAPFESNSQYWIQSGGSATIDEGLAICTDSNNNVYTTGYFTSVFNMNGQQLVSQGLEDIFISKMSNTGAPTWLIRAGGTNQERALSIDADNSGNIVITGYFYGTTTFGTTQLTSQGQQDIFIAKYNSSGTLQWARQAGGINSDLGNIVKFDNAGNIIVAGEFSGSCSFNSTTLVSQAGSIDAFISKYDANGILIWAKKGSGQYSDRGTGIAIDLQNNVYVSGMFSDTITFDLVHPNTMMNSVFIVKLNSNGNEQWFRWLGSGTSISSGGINYFTNGINITGSFSGQLIFLGSSTSTTINPTFFYNVFIARINSTGNLEFLTSNGSDNEVKGTSITSKSNGEIVIAGNFKCRFTDYSAQYGSGIFCSVGYEDNFVAGYSITGSWIWARHFGGKQRDVVNSIAMRNDSIPVMTGVFSDNYCVPVNLTQTTSYGVPNFDYTSVFSVLNYCNDNSYGNYVVYNTKGNSDVFINSAINMNREPLDYFNRASGICNRDYNNMCITSGPLGNCADTIVTCSVANLSFQPGLGTYDVFNYFLSPSFNNIWSNGATTGSIITAALGPYSVTATSIDGCFTHNDSAFVSSSYQPIPAIADNKGINFGTTNPLPVQLCAPDSVLLQCTNVNNSSVQWTGFPMGMNPINVTTSGTYTCTLINQYGCIFANNITVTITTPLTTTIEPMLKWVDDLDGNDSITVCENESFEIFVYDEISNPGGTIMQCIPDLTIANFSIDTTMTGSFTYEFNTSCPNLLNSFIGTVPMNTELIMRIQVVRTNPCGSDTMYVTDTLFVQVNPANVGTLNFNVTGPDEFCPGTTVALVASPPQYNYTWSNFAAGNTLYISQPGLYSVTGVSISTNSFGCIDSLIGIVYDSVTFYPQPVINLNPSTGIICPNDSVQLQCPGPILTEWYGPSGALASGTNLIYSNIPGNYFCYQNMDSTCVLLSNTVSLTQFSSPSLQAFPPTFCLTDSTSLLVLASQGSVIQWLPPLSGSSPSQFVTNAGTYFCEVISCGDTSLLSITVNTYTPVSAPTISFTPPILTSSLAQGYQWYVNGFPLPSANSQTYSPTVQGTYTVMVTDSNGCTALSDPFVLTSIHENNLENYIHFTPNPTTNFIQLSILNSKVNLKDAIVIIRNMHGQILRHEPLSSDLKINITGISNGIYSFEMVSKNVLYKKKFVVQN